MNYLKFPKASQLVIKYILFCIHICNACKCIYLTVCFFLRIMSCSMKYKMIGTFNFFYGNYSQGIASGCTVLSYALAKKKN